MDAGVNNNRKTRIISIDLGTSTTVVRVHNVGEGNRVVPVAVNGMGTIPTIAFQLDGSNEMYYGYDAQAKYDSNAAGSLFKNFKMDLISENEIERVRAEELILGFLRYVYDQYQSLLNKEAFDPADEIKVYVSHPAKWNSYARTQMKQIVEKAGFCKQSNITLKDEPTAALLSVIHEKNTELKQAGMLFEGKEYKAMMIDMGAGTTDIVLCTYKVTDKKLKVDNIFTYPSISNPGLCGGREIDEAIVSAAEVFVNKMQVKPSASGNKVINKLSRGVKRWKDKTVSLVLRDNIALPEPDDISAFRDTLYEFGVPVMNEHERFSITREYFETFTKGHWEQWVNLLKGTFDEVKGVQYDSLICPKNPEEVELLIITGGHSQWYVVQEYLLGKTGFIDLPQLDFARIHAHPELLVQSGNPQETVAVGLCHIDEDVVGALAAANDVSISFTCEGKYLGACELIRKGVPLPFAKNDFLITNSIDGNFIFRRELKIDYSIVTDKINTIKKSITVPSDGILATLIKTVLSFVGVAIFDVPRILYYMVMGKLDELDDTLLQTIVNNEYKVELSPDILVNEEGIIKVGGIIKVDGESLNIPQIVI